MSLSQLLTGLKVKSSFENDQADPEDKTENTDEAGTAETGNEGETEGAEEDEASTEDEAEGTEEENSEPADGEPGTGEIEPEDADATIPVYESIPTDDETKEIVEMNSSMESHDIAIDDSDDIEERILNLDRLRTVADNSLENGGLNQDGAAALKVGLELITSQDRVATITPSVESFGGIHQRRVSTEASSRGIGEIIKSAIAAAGKFIMDIFKRGKEAFLRLFDTKKAIEHKASLVEEAAKGFKGNVKDVSLSASEAKALSINGKVESGNALVNQYVAVVAKLRKLTDDGAPFTFVKAITSLKVDTSSDDAFKNSYDAAVKVLTGFPVNAEFSKDVTSEYKEYLDLGLQVRSTEDLFGATEILACSIKGEAKGAKQAGMQFVRKNSTKVAETKSIKGIPADGVLKVVEATKSVAAIMDQAKDRATRIDGILKDLNTFIKSLETSSSKASTLSTSAAAELKELIAALRKVMTSMTVQYLTSSSCVVNATNAILKVCNTSMKGSSEAAKSGDAKALPGASTPLLN